MHGSGKKYWYVWLEYPHLWGLPEMQAFQSGNDRRKALREIHHSSEYARREMLLFIWLVGGPTAVIALVALVCGPDLLQLAFRKSFPLILAATGSLGIVGMWFCRRWFVVARSWSRGFSC